MATHSVMEANGLHTTANQLSAVPRGAARVAKNVVVRSKDIWEPRRGQNPLSYVLGANVYERPDEIAFFAGTPLVHRDNRFLSRDTGSAFSDYSAGPFAAPDPDVLRMKFAEANGKLYFTTAAGIKALESAAGTPAAAGIPKPFNVETRSALYDAGSATPNWLPTANQVGLRVIFIKKDDRGNVQQGPPSEAAVLVNGSGSGRAVRVHIGLPSEITDEHLYRIFMTDPSGSASIHPGDEQYLVYEGPITSADVTARFASKDITNEEAVLSSIPLYTNPNDGNGIEAAKHQPPLAKDLCYWGNALWAFGVKQKHRVEFTILGINTGAGGTGIAVSDGFDISTTNGSTDHFKFDFQSTSTEPTFDAANGWLVPLDVASGTATERVRNTAKALVWAINEASIQADETPSTNMWGTTERFRAYYVDDPDGWPGKIIIEGASLGGNQFSINTTEAHGLAYSPRLGLGDSSPFGALLSTQDDNPHWAWHTPIDEPEAWPLANFIPVGKRGSTILRGIPLRDGLFCFMDDGTVQVIRGRAGNYRVDELDSTATLIGADTAAVLNNQIWAFTDQGVVSVTEAGVSLIGLPVEADTAQLFGAALETVKQRAFGFGYETERQYCLWLPERAGQAHCSVGYVYNYVTRAWSTWPLERSCGRVNPLTKVLYMGHATQNKVWKERKTLTADDYADETVSITISSASGTTLTVASTSGVAAGDVVEQGLLRAVIQTVTDATHLELHTAETWVGGPEWEAGAATVYKAFECEIAWVPTALGSPGLLKNLSDFTLTFLELACQKAQAWLSTDISFAWSRTKAFDRDGYGSQAWGNYPWGDPAGPYNERMGASGEKHSATFVTPRFTIREAFAQWKLAGYSLEHELVSERTKR